MEVEAMAMNGFCKDPNLDGSVRSWTLVGVGAYLFAEDADRIF